MKSIKFIIFLISIIFAKHHNYYHHLADILKPKGNFFSKTMENIQNIINNVFENLELSEQFIEQPKIKLLLTMLHDLNNIAENNCEIYNLLKNISVVKNNNEAVNVIKLDELVREIVNEIPNNVNNKTNDKDSEHIRSTRTTEKLPSEFENSKEFKEFIKQILGKVRSLTVDDLIKENDSSDNTFSSRRQLEVWEPPTSLEMYFRPNYTESRRVYRGKETNISKFPFIVSVHILNDFMCAGNIISKDLILTAASCMQIHYNNRFFRENPKSTYVRIGSDWSSRNGELVAVLEIYFYPSYNPKTLKNNLAILRLERCIKFKSSYRNKIRRIQLDSGEGYLPSNTDEIIILGWGSKNDAQIVRTYEKISCASLPIYPIDECREIYSKQYVTDRNFCAGYLSKASGACNRDIGGPGIVGGVLAGIISFGPPVCGAVNYPTVFTRIGHYIDWIEPIINMYPVRFHARTSQMPTIPVSHYFATEATQIHLYPIMMQTIPLKPQK